MYWLFMFAAISFEVVGTLSLKLSDGFSRPLFVGVTIIGYLASFGCLGLALKGIPVSTAYAIWAGVGTAVIAIIGMLFMSEPANGVKYASVALIVLGVVGLHLADRIA
ncbi:MAG: multidrug efflux SMR transporter [Rhodospirillales bacterium]|nr:multidrug efflux SMR transporter [Rhodospirillales bacterium]MBO6785435.1 multidrug efflux SMR transporter [Rhodospirillales bacterium]